MITIAYLRELARLNCGPCDLLPLFQNIRFLYIHTKSCLDTFTSQTKNILYFKMRKYTSVTKDTRQATFYKKRLLQKKRWLNRGGNG
jgi:hypothetical protein